METQDDIEQIGTDLRQHLRDLRVARGLTQADIAKAPKLTQSIVSRFEANEGAGVSLRTLIRMARAIAPEAVVELRLVGVDIAEK